MNPQTDTSSLKAILPAKLKQVNTALDKLVQDLSHKVAKEDTFTRAAIDSYLSLIRRGGKRLRGVLTLIGYELYGGQDHAMASQAAAVVEACHAYMLVIDDVADKAVMRRNGPSAHVQMNDFIVKHSLSTDPALGISMAEAAALVAQHYAQSAILRLDAPPKHVILAANILNQRLVRTGIGQLRDLSPIEWDTVDLDGILKTATDKTAYYTFLLPLQLGAALAGAPEEELKLFESYSLNAGLAFQLHDDIMGTFGDEATTGKSRMSDMIEGKKTVLMVKALAKASPRDKKTLLAALGNSSLQPPTFDRCLAIIQKSGALDETRALASEYAKRAVQALDQAPLHWSASALQFLRSLALYGVERAS